MTTWTSTPITLKNSGDIVAAVPHLLGFHPRDSLVLVTHEGRHSSAVGLTLRADLPPAEHEAQLARQLLEPVLRQPGRAVTAIVVGRGPDDRPPDPPRSLPARSLVTSLRRAFRRGGVRVTEALWAAEIRAGRRWWCYLDRNHAGVLDDPRGSVLAARSAALGLVTYHSREDLAATLDTDDEVAIRRRARLLAEAASAAPEVPARQRHAAIGAAVAAVRDGTFTVTDEAVLTLAGALADHRVRDSWLVLDDPADTAAAQRLWAVLTRSLPAPARAEPACLLACSAFLQGDGAMVGVALDVAEAADPDHVLTGLLRHAQQGGMPPSQLAATVRRAVGRDVAAP